MAGLLSYLRLLRVGTLLSPAADVTAGLCLAGLDWSAAGARTALASSLVYAAGMVLNDHADRRADAVLRPERPLPSGQIRPASALALGVALLAAGIAASAWPLYHGVLAALVLGYDYVLKRAVWPGVLTMGLLRALNLAAGAVALTHQAPPRTVVIAAGAYGLYIVAVTCLGIMEDQPRVTRRTLVSIQTVPPLCGALALLGMPRPWPAAAIGFGLAALFLARMHSIRTWSQAAIRGSMVWLLLGTMAYTALLCLSAGRWPEALVISIAVLPARWISRRIAMT